MVLLRDVFLFQSSNGDQMVIDIRNLREIKSQLLENYFESGLNIENLIENDQNITLPYASIRSREWYFDGIRIGYSDWTYQEQVALKWSFDIHVELITLYVNLKGSIQFGDDTDSSFSLLSSQHNLFYSLPGISDEGILRQENSKLTMFMIQFPKDFFIKLTQDSNDVLNRFGDHILRGESAPLSMHNLYIDVNMRNIINSIISCRYTGGLKKMFLLSKSIELLVLQAEAYNLSNGVKYKFLKTKYDKECIQYAMEYLTHHLNSPPSLSELTKIAGVNEYKLKKSFKEIFGTTVFGYVAEARLDSAKNDLFENTKSISEIAQLLGYSSVNHFSYAFKKKFGVPPSKIKFKS